MATLGEQFASAVAAAAAAQAALHTAAQEAAAEAAAHRETLAPPAPAVKQGEGGTS